MVTPKRLINPNIYRQVTFLLLPCVHHEICACGTLMLC